MKKEIPDYSQVRRGQVPEEFKWKVTDLYPDQVSWEKDKQLLVEMIARIDQLKEGWTGSPEKMFQLMNHVSETEKKEDSVYTYTTLLVDTDQSNSTWQALKGEVQTISVDFQGKLAFIDPDILELGEEKIAEYLEADPRLRIYGQDFKTTLRMRKYILSEDKERIMADVGLFSGAPQKASRLLNDVDIPAPNITLAEGKRIPLDPANYIRYRDSKNRKDRFKVMRTFWKHHAKYKNTHAALLDGHVKNHFFRVKTRGYKDCLEAALYPNQIDPGVYYTLIETIKENTGPLHRYLKLKARLLGLETFSYEDIYASSVPAVDKSYTIEEAGEIILASLKPLGKEYLDVLASGLKAGWMDIYPNKGKRTGAYCNGSISDGHPYVLMNYNGTFNHVSTLAHEYGHAMHSWFSNTTQPYPLRDYPTFLAEIASTFNETLLVHHMVNTEPDDLVKLFILDQYLEEFRGTLYRQTLFADFELKIHQRVESGQSLTPEWLDNIYLELTRHYYGHKQRVISVGKHIENEWSNVPHFYYNFYVYQYSTGIAAAAALAAMVLDGGESERKKYMNFLKSGCSKYPLDTLKDAGLDMTTPQPIITAVAKFEGIVEEMEKIVARLEKQ